MIEVAITKEMIAEAERKANIYKDNLTHSIRAGRGTIIGCLGEELFKHYLPEAEFVGSYDYDFEFRGEKYDVKTKERSVNPKPYYECSVNAETYNQKTDYYVFASILSDMSKGWLVGYSNKPFFVKKAILIKKGEFDPSNNFRSHTNMLNMRIDKLAPMKRLFEK